MTLIKKPDQLLVCPKIKALIYGAAGIGKTTLALSSKNPLLFDCDNGFYRTNEAHWKDAVQVSKEVVDERIKKAALQGEMLDPEDMLYGFDAINYALDNDDLSGFDIIIIDTFGRLLDYMAEKIIADNQGNPKIVMRDGSLALGGYGVLKTMFSSFCRKVTSKGKHLLFVAHDKGKTAKGSDIERREVLSLGSSYDTVKTELDLVLYMYYNNSTRMITANPSQFNDGKNTIGLPDMAVPIVVDANGIGLKNDFFDTYIIQPYMTRMNNIEKMQKAYSSAIAKIDEMIAMIDSAEKANEFATNVIKEGNTFEHTGSSMMYARDALRKVAQQLGLKVNQEKKCYE